MGEKDEMSALCDLTDHIASTQNSVEWLVT